MHWILKYFLAFLVHIAWMRLGKTGPIPRLPLPRGRSLHLPALEAWQTMAGLWIIRKLWLRYGGTVKGNLMAHPHRLANSLGGLLPDAPLPKPRATTKLQPSLGPPAHTPRQYDTQPLSNTPASPLPSGSVLNSLRSATDS